MDRHTCTDYVAHEAAMFCPKQWPNHCKAPMHEMNISVRATDGCRGPQICKDCPALLEAAKQSDCTIVHLNAIGLPIDPKLVTSQDVRSAETFIRMGGLAFVPEFMELFHKDGDGKPKSE